MCTGLHRRAAVAVDAIFSGWLVGLRRSDLALDSLWRLGAHLQRATDSPEIDFSPDDDAPEKVNFLPTISETEQTVIETGTV